jgi:glycosyltransferase involved in cell wall biosynthesis
MRIGIDIRELERGKRTGIGRYLRNFISSAPALCPGLRLFLYGNQFTDTDSLSDANRGDSVTVRVAAQGRTFWWDQVVLPRLANRDRLDIFLSPYIKGPVGVECPLAVTIHDLMFLVFDAYRTWRRWPANAYVRKVGRWAGRRADLILTDSAHSRQDIIRILQPDPAKVKVLPIGVESRYRPVSDHRALESVCAGYGITPPYVLYLGNFRPHKNVQGLISAFARLESRTRERYQLVLGGAADEWTPDRRRLAGELGIAGRTRFIGPVAEPDMPGLFSGAELFVFPSYYEGFGLPPLEAMACGTAVIASDRTSLPEVVGEAGQLVDPDDTEALSGAIQDLLENDAARNELEQKGLRRAAAFTAEAICERHLELLAQAARSPRGIRGSAR